MLKLDQQFVQEAFKAESVWDLGNGVLYKLCEEHPDHAECQTIIAKVWLIGRSYAAAIERRRGKGNFSGDDFYVKCVAPHIRSSDINIWFRELRQDESRNATTALKVHKRFMDSLKTITKQDNRSFASKYLHFHFPSRFFIYDSRAAKSVGELVENRSPKRHFSEGVDTEYAHFFSRCEELSRRIRDLIGRDPEPRDVDKVLLAWSRRLKGAQ